MWTHLVLIATLAFSPPAPRFTDAARRSKLETAFPQIDRILENYKQARGVPGLVYGVVIDGELAHVKCLGVRDRDSGDRVTPETLFRIASMTKSFTALAILKLRDEGKLSLEDPVAKWIPEFAGIRYPTRDTAPIRIRQLLTHGAGFPEDNPWGDRQLGIADSTLTGWLRKGIPFSTPPDTSYEYSNYGFALLGRIVARASGMDYQEYLEKEILAPLGMKSSTLEPYSVPERLRAKGYRKNGEAYAEEPPLRHGAFGAMGGLLTNARDLARYLAYQLSAYPPRDDVDPGPVRRSSLREMQNAWRWMALDPERGSVSGYGYGLVVSRDRRFQHIVGHGGGLPGFGSYMLWLPEYGVGLFAMANLTYAGPVTALQESLDALRATGGLQPRVLPPSPELVSAQGAILRLWRRWEDKEAAAVTADNFFLDRPAAERRAEIEQLKEALGTCRPTGEVAPENFLRGTFRMACDHGELSVSFTLAPTVPPKIQYLKFQKITTHSHEIQ